MKKLLIAAVALLPFLGSCDKDNGNDEPTPENDTVPAIDTAQIADTVVNIDYIEFCKYTNGPVPIRFDSLAKAYPNDRLWFKMHFYAATPSIIVYRGVDTIVESHHCLIEYSAENLYAWGYVNKWERCEYILEDNNQFALQSISGSKSVECDFNLNEGDEYYLFRTENRYDTVIVDSIVSRKMNNNIVKRWFYLSGEYFSATWIEGIGDVNSGYHTLPDDLAGDATMLVVRYYEKGELVYDSHSAFEGTLFVSQ